MQPLVALLVSTALLLAVAPTAPAAAPPGEHDTIGLSLDADAIAEEATSPSLDDDVVHSHPIVCAPCRVVRLRPEVRSDERDGVTHTSEPRPPRAC